MPAQRRGFIQMAQAERGPAAAFAVDGQAHVVSGRAEDLHSGPADSRLVVPHVGVVP